MNVPCPTPETALACCVATALSGAKNACKDAGHAPVDHHAQVAQLVEQRIENPRVGGSIPPLGTISF
jgi:hypothetical protein